MSFENSKQTIFTSTQLDYEEIVEIPEGYEKAELKDFEDGTLIRGRPEMAGGGALSPSGHRSGRQQRP